MEQLFQAYITLLFWAVYTNTNSLPKYSVVSRLWEANENWFVSFEWTSSQQTQANDRNCFKEDWTHSSFMILPLLNTAAWYSSIAEKFYDPPLNEQLYDPPLAVKLDDIFLAEQLDPPFAEHLNDPVFAEQPNDPQ